jgi:hypothetical protein
MKKVIFVLVLMMATLVVNAQFRGATNVTMPTVTIVKKADLPKAIKDNVAKDYTGFAIKGATCTNTNNVITYAVVIVKGTTTETLVYDKEGKFIKKEAQNVVEAPDPKKK